MSFRNLVAQQYFDESFPPHLTHKKAPRLELASQGAKQLKKRNGCAMMPPRLSEYRCVAHHGDGGHPVTTAKGLPPSGVAILLDELVFRLAELLPGCLYIGLLGGFHLIPAALLHLLKDLELIADRGVHVRAEHLADLWVAAFDDVAAVHGRDVFLRVEHIAQHALIVPLGASPLGVRGIVHGIVHAFRLLTAG